MQGTRFFYSLCYSPKVLTCVEYRAVSRVFQNIDPPPLSPPSECVLPPHQRRGYTLAGRWGGWGVNILEDERHRIGLLQYNLFTVTAQQSCGPGGEGSLAYERYLGRQLQGFEEDVVSLQNILMSSGYIQQFIFMSSVWLKTKKNFVAFRKFYTVSGAIPNTLGTVFWSSPDQVLLTRDSTIL